MKHLSVLEDAGLLEVQRRGRERWNYLNAATLETALRDWVTPFQKEWAIRLKRLKTRLEKEDMTHSEVLGLDIRQSVRIAASRERAFNALTKEVDLWWGSGYRQTGKGSHIALDLEIGANMVERDAAGHAVIWGRIEEIRTPDLLYLSGRFAVPGAVAGRVHFDLEDAEVGCRLQVTHQAVGAIDQEVRERFATGWRELLGTQLRQHVERG
jgi:uncharacterized protein YndB with AHSA1/START domain